MDIYSASQKFIQSGDNLVIKGRVVEGSKFALIELNVCYRCYVRRSEAETWNTTLSMLRSFGRVVIAGTTSGDMGTQDLSDIYVCQLSIFGARMGTKEEFEKVLELVSAGKLKPIIDKVFPLKEATEAQQRMLEGKHIGKIVLEI